MATVAHGRTSSNNQRGTVGLSAGDWIRLKRLRGARGYATTVSDNTDVDIPTVGQMTRAVPMLAPKHTGASRIRRTNGQWTDYVASQTADYVLNTGEFDSVGYPRILYPVRVCDCSTIIPPVPKMAGTRKCGVYTHKTIQ